MKVLVGQLNPTVGAIEKNLAAMMQAVRDNPTAQIVVFPELAVSGYPPKDLLAYPDFVQACLKANDALQKLSTPNRLVIWGNIGRHTGPGKPLMNAGYAAFNGHIIATATKCHLPTYDVFDEARYFEPAYPQHAVAFFEAFNQRFALTLCEDLWSHPAIADMQKDSVAPVTYPSTPLHTLAQTSCDIIVNLSASPYELNKPALRRELVQQIAQVQQAAILYVNQVGANDDVIFDGNSLLCLANGATWQAQAFVSDAALLDIQLCSRLCTQSVGEALVASRPVTRQGNQDESIVVACHHCGRHKGLPYKRTISPLKPN